MPPARAVHGHPVGLRARGDGAGPAEPHPAGLGHPDLADVAGYAAHVPLLPALTGDPEPLMPSGLAPRQPPGRVARVEERCHRPGEVPQGLLLHRLGACGQPRVSARAAVSCRQGSPLAIGRHCDGATLGTVTADRYVPTSEDRSSSGVWTFGWQGVDVFGGATRPPCPPSWPPPPSPG